MRVICEEFTPKSQINCQISHVKNISDKINNRFIKRNAIMTDNLIKMIEIKVNQLTNMQKKPQVTLSQTRVSKGFSYLIIGFGKISV